MKVVILCGGEGTRLREETEYRPKPMIEVGGKPILWHIMKIYAHFGFREFVLCLGYRGNVIKDYFLNYDLMRSDLTVGLGERKGIEIHGEDSAEDWCVTLAETGADSLTGSRIKLIEKYVDTERFMVTYGDGLADVDIRELLEHHDKSGKIATLTGVHPPSRYGQVGIVDTPSGEKVTGFSEKPRMDDVINAGFFVFEREVFDYIPDENVMLEHEPFQKLVADSQFSVYRHNGYWQSMDTYRDYKLLNDEWSRGAPWKVW